MSQHYSNPVRATDPHALPDVEVFYLSEAECKTALLGQEEPTRGWYWWHCFPGCLPDGEAVGPFESEADAVADMEETSADALLS
jgi:hypothetical protein